MKRNLAIPIPSSPPSKRQKSHLKKPSPFPFCLLPLELRQRIYDTIAAPAWSALSSSPASPTPNFFSFFARDFPSNCAMARVGGQLQAEFLANLSRQTSFSFVVTSSPFDRGVAWHRLSADAAFESFALPAGPEFFADWVREAKVEFRVRPREGLDTRAAIHDFVDSMNNVFKPCKSMRRLTVDVVFETLVFESVAVEELMPLRSLPGIWRIYLSCSKSDLRWLPAEWETAWKAPVVEDDE